MKRRFREYGISERAREQCRMLQLSPEEAMSYARQAAPFTHPQFNRRYEEFVFSVRQLTIEEVGLFADNEPAKLMKDAAAIALLQRAHALFEELLETAQLDGASDEVVGDLELLVDEIEQHIRRQENG